MATKRKTSKRSSQGGSTLYGVLAGLLIGLVVAAAVAFYVTKAPMPFVDRASRGTPDNTKQPDPRNAPDPNQGLYGRDGPAGTARGAQDDDLAVRDVEVELHGQPPPADVSLGGGSGTPHPRKPALPAHFRRVTRGYAVRPAVPYAGDLLDTSP